MAKDKYSAQQSILSMVMRKTPLPVFPPQPRIKWNQVLVRLMNRRAVVHLYLPRLNVPWEFDSNDYSAALAHSTCPCGAFRSAALLGNSCALSSQLDSR